MATLDPFTVEPCDGALCPPTSELASYERGGIVVHDEANLVVGGAGGLQVFAKDSESVRPSVWGQSEPSRI